MRTFRAHFIVLHRSIDQGNSETQHPKRCWYHEALGFTCVLVISDSW